MPKSSGVVFVWFGCLLEWLTSIRIDFKNYTEQ